MVTIYRYSYNEIDVYFGVDGWSIYVKAVPKDTSIARVGYTLLNSSGDVVPVTQRTENVNGMDMLVLIPESPIPGQYTLQVTGYNNQNQAVVALKIHTYLPGGEDQNSDQNGSNSINTEELEQALKTYLKYLAIGIGVLIGASILLRLVNVALAEKSKKEEKT